MDKLRKFAPFPFNCTGSLEIITYGDKPRNILFSPDTYEHRANPDSYIKNVGVHVDLSSIDAYSVACNTFF